MLDIVTKYFFGQEMGFLKHGDSVGMLADTRANGPIIHVLARLPRLKMFLLRSLGKFLVPTAGDGSGLGNVLQVRRSVICACKSDDGILLAQGQTLRRTACKWQQGFANWTRSVSREETVNHACTKTT